MDLEQSIYIITILFFAFLYSFYFAPNESIPESFKNMHQSCLFGECRTDRCNQIAKRRGNSYILENNEKNKGIKKCSITWWNGAHFMMYAILTYIAPNLALGFMILGIGFEYYEYKVYDCGDYMDIIANNLGILTGFALSKQ